MATGLTAIVGRECPEPEDPAKAKTSLLIESLLPLLRIYITWLAAHRHELFGAAEALGPVLPEMAQALARVFTLLCTETYTQENLASCPYLLQEDIETQGLLSLSKEQVPLACRSSHSEDGALKPRQASDENRLSPFQETLARILDILRCAYFLAEDPTVPLTYQVLENGLVFEYQENFKPQVPAPMATHTISQPAAAANASLHEISAGSQVADQQHAASSDRQPPSRSVARDKAKKAAAMASLAQARHQAPSPDHAENTVINMLAPFLKPPTPEPGQQHLRSPDESSYGMHSTTANEVFGLLHSEPSPTGSLPPGKFEPLPWNWVYTPTPHSANDVSASATKDAFDAPVSPRFAAKDVPHASGAHDDPFNSPRRHLSAGFIPRSASSMMGSPRVASVSEEVHRNQLLQSFASTSAPRTSTFSQWGQNTTRVPKETAPPSYCHQAFNGYPISSAASAFSHPSSLYQGTPANGAAFGMPEDGFGAMNRFGRGPSQDSAPSSSARHFQMDETASSYDAAILQAAFHNNK